MEARRSRVLEQVEGWGGGGLGPGVSLCNNVYASLRCADTMRLQVISTGTFAKACAKRNAFKDKLMIWLQNPGRCPGPFLHTYRKLTFTHSHTVDYTANTDPRAHKKLDLLLTSGATKAKPQKAQSDTTGRQPLVYCSSHRHLRACRHASTHHSSSSSMAIHDSRGKNCIKVQSCV